MKINALISVLQDFSLQGATDVLFSSDEEGNSIYHLAEVQTTDIITATKPTTVSKSICIYPYGESI